MENQRQEDQRSKAKRRKIDEEAFKRQNRQVKKKSRAKITEKQRGEACRARKFRRAIMLGDIFVCSSCERELFEQNVTKIDGLEEKVFLARADPQRFGKRLRPLYEGPDVDLYLDASVTELETAPDRVGVTGARLRTSGGRELSLRARARIIRDTASATGMPACRPPRGPDSGAVAAAP